MSTLLPPAGSFCPMTEFVGQSKVALYHTGSSTFNYEYNAVYSWNGTVWSLAAPFSTLTAASVALRTFPGWGSDGTNMILQGGTAYSAFLSDTWNVNSSSAFSNVVQYSGQPPGGIFQRKAPYMAYNSGNTTLYLTQGGDINLQYVDVWSWTNGAQAWSNVATTTNPSARRGAGFVSDTSNCWLMFGKDARGQGGYLKDVWKFSTGSGTWAQQTLTNGPSVRADFGLVWDRTASLFIMFGGQDGNGLINQTYTSTNGTTWVNATPSSITPFNSPSGRIGCSMSYDPAGGQTLLFGGSNGVQNLADTWAYKSGAWSRLF